MKKITLINNEIIISNDFPSADGELYVVSNDAKGCTRCVFNDNTPLGRICDYMPKKAIRLCKKGELVWRPAKTTNKEKVVFPDIKKNEDYSTYGPQRCALCGGKIFFERAMKSAKHTYKKEIVCEICMSVCGHLAYGIYTA